MGLCSSRLDGVDRTESQKQAAVAASAAEAQEGLPAVDKTKPLRSSVLGRDQPEDVHDDYEIGGVLGVGQFGVIRLCTDKASKQYACKSINKSHLHESEVEKIRQELQIMHHVAGHQHVVQVVRALEDHSHVHIIMELCSGGDLVDIVTSQGQYTEKDAAAAVRTMLEVVAYCHDMGVVHRDLKLENFLMEGAGCCCDRIKATDFGLSTFFKPGQRLSDVVGTAFYMAPEVLMKDYDERADVWALGVILYILLCGRPPFDHAKDEDIFRAIMDNGRPDFSACTWDNISQPAKECVERMMTWDARKRPSAREMLQHPWIRKDGVAGSNIIEPEVIRRLKAFANMNAFKKHTLTFMAHNMSADEVKGLKEMFESMDTDKSGTISLDELKEGLQRRGVHIPDPMLQQIMDLADLNRNRCLDYDEFVGATLHMCKLQQEDKLLDAFRHVDTDGDGFISRQELTAALAADIEDTHKLQSAVLEALQDADTNGDGLIDYTEFVSMMVPEGRKENRRHNSAAEFSTKWLKQHQVKQQQVQGEVRDVPGTADTIRTGRDQVAVSVA